ncbi:hypothetical protein [Litchfieldia alkalitelluris]|uniref:hypothetical protein n=1 Tax=Litchfieldia alkalitelluris TaxID=304268 RepID=UPI0009967F09|nr:hypothetical protein [Litchfieldia alkalitelluris]
MPKKNKVTITVEDENSASVKAIKKYRNKAKNILSGNAVTGSNRSSNIKITNNSIITKKVVHS